MQEKGSHSCSRQIKDKHSIALGTDKHEHLPVLAKIILKWFSRTSCRSEGIHRFAAVKVHIHILHRLPSLSMSVSSGKVFRIGTVHYNWPMSAHASQAFSIAYCTEDLPSSVLQHRVNIILKQYQYP